MVGKITVMVQDKAGQMVAPPLIYEFGISKYRMIFPISSQKSNLFWGLPAGDYFVFYRETGKDWDSNQVLKEVVTFPVDAAPNDSVKYTKVGNSVLLTTAEGTEIRTKLAHQRLTIDSSGQQTFVMPVEAQSGLVALLINAERYYEGSYILTENSTKLVWQNLFELNSDDVVMVEYIIQILM